MVLWLFIMTVEQIAEGECRSWLAVAGIRWQFLHESARQVQPQIITDDPLHYNCRFAKGCTDVLVKGLER